MEKRSDASSWSPEHIGAELSVFAQADFSAPWTQHLRYYDLHLEYGDRGPLPSDDALFAFDLFDKALRRGSLPFPSYEIERRIVNVYGRRFGLEEDERAPASIRYRYDSSLRAAYEEFRELADDWNGDIAAVAVDPEHPDNERRLLQKLVAEFGGKIINFLYPQASLTDVLPRDMADEFTGQRADFLIVFPNGRGLVLEPGDHEGADQKGRDTSRDKAFADLGFSTLRPRNRQLDAPALYASIRTKFNELGVTEYLAGGDPTSQRQLDASYLFLLPALVARVEHVLADFMLRRNLITSESLELGVFERDLVAAEWAILSFLERLERIRALYGLNLRVPDLELKVARNPSYACGDLAPLHAELEERNCRVYTAPPGRDFDRCDLVLDISAKANRLTAPFTCTAPNRACLRATHPHRRPVRFSYQSRPRSIVLDKKAEDLTRSFLRDFFRKRELRPGQYPILANSLAQKPTIGLLPTSAGKSICYQLASLLTPGTTLVVDPIVALMSDQLQGLAEFYRIDRVAAWHAGSEIRDSEAPRVLSENVIAFVTPERLLRPGFRKALRSLSALDVYVNYAVIDEAHCVSMWGHDFRPSYLSLDRNFREYCSFQGRRPVTLALTGTASQLVLIDLKRELNIEDLDAIVRPKTFDREELNFRIVRCGNDQKEETLRLVMERIASQLGVRNAMNEAWGIVFAYRPNEVWRLFGRFVGSASESVRTVLAGDRNREICYGMYSGGRPKDSGFTQKDWDRYKKLTLEAFKRGDIRMLFGNTAVSVGIDSERLNYVVNYRMPQSLEAYYQQCGRAGRNGQQSECVLIFSDDRPEATQQWLARDSERMPRRSDDLGTVSFFHEGSFPGREVDANGAFEILKVIFQDQRDASGRTLVGQQNDRTEKYVAYWLILGVVEDYEVSGGFSSTQYHIRHHPVIRQYMETRDDAGLESHFVSQLHRYLSRYRPTALADIQRALDERSEERLSRRVIGFLIDFIYDQMAYQRREAIRTMVEFCTEEDSEPERIRARIKAYFDTSEKFSEKLMAMSEEVAQVSLVAEVIELVEGFDDIEHLYWETRRLLDERFRPDWAAINLFAILYREREVGEAARRLIGEIADALQSEPQLSLAAEQNFIAALISTLTRIDEAYGNELSHVLMRDLLTELYGRHGIRYLPAIEMLDGPQETRDYLTASFAAKQLGELANASRYSFSAR